MVNHSRSISLKSLSINCQNFDILKKEERYSVGDVRRNLVQINFIRLNNHSKTAVDGGSKAAGVRIFVLSEHDAQGEVLNDRTSA